MFSLKNYGSNNNVAFCSKIVYWENIPYYIRLFQKLVRA